MNNTNPEQQPPPPEWLAVAVGLCVLAAFLGVALAFLWLLSQLPLVGFVFEFALDAILTTLRGLRDMVVWLVVFIIKLAITLLFFAFLTGAFKHNAVRFALGATFVVWLWTGLFDERPPSRLDDAEMKRAIEFSEAWQRMKLANEWHSNYFRQ